MRKWTKHSEETIEKISEKLKWKWCWNKWKIWIYSEESKEKMRESARKRGCNHPAEYRKWMSEKWKWESNPRFKPIWTKKDNWHWYILIKIANWQWFKNWEFEHIVRMEEKIWRKINKRIECVHHIDHNKKNNAIENIQLMTIKEHKKLHLKDSIHKHFPLYNFIFLIYFDYAKNKFAKLVK